MRTPIPTEPGVYLFVGELNPKHRMKPFKFGVGAACLWFVLPNGRWWSQYLTDDIKNLCGVFVRISPEIIDAAEAQAQELIHRRIAEHIASLTGYDRLDSLRSLSPDLRAVVEDYMKEKKDE